MRVRATTKLQNDKMIATREKLGLSQIEISKIVGINATSYARYERLQYPSKRTRRNVEVASEIAEVLGIELNDVFPEGADGLKIPKNIIRVADIEMSNMLEYRANQQKRLVCEVGDDLEDEAIKETASAAISCLTLREREVVELYFGMADGHTYTTAEIGLILKLTSSRISQILGTARRRMQYHLLHDSKKEKVE